MDDHLWFGFKRLDFEFEGRKAILVFPEKPDNMGRWALKTEYFGAFPDTELELLRRGFHLAYLENKNRWGCDVDHHAKSRFANYLANTYSLRRRFVSVGMSCGGLHAVNFASRYPEYVSLLYLDAPVLNLLSCPLGLGKGDALGENNSGWEELVSACGFTMSDIICYREHPIDRLHILTDNRLPVALVYGDSDSVVPYEENGLILRRHYEKTDIPFFVRGKSGCGHHPHGLSDPDELVDFIEKYSL
ncbi:MAG: hypothetical protein GX633_02550 [Clostridiales bacterium]|mgnify:CR=1 FL=1|nr:hypothetical protein [Clostridiales bacterium]